MKSHQNYNFFIFISLLLISIKLPAQFDVTDYKSTDIVRNYKTPYDSTSNQPLESLYDYIGQNLLCNYPSNWSPDFYSNIYSKKLYKEKSIKYDKKNESYGTRMWELCNAFPNGIYTETFTPKIYLQRKKFKVTGVKITEDRNIYLELKDDNNETLYFPYGWDSKDPDYEIKVDQFPFICEGFYKKCKQVFEGKSYSYSYSCTFGHLNPFSDYVTKHKIKDVLIRPNISKVILDVIEIKQNLKDFTIIEKEIESYELGDLSSNDRYLPSELEKIMKGYEYKDDYKSISNEPYNNVMGYKGETLIYFFTDSLSLQNIISNSDRLENNQLQLSNGERLTVTDVILKNNDYPLLELETINGGKLYYSYEYDGWDRCVKPVYNFPFITLSFYKKALDLQNSVYDGNYSAGSYRTIVTNVYLDSTKAKVKVDLTTTYKSVLKSENKTVSKTHSLSDLENSTISNLKYLLENGEQRAKQEKEKKKKRIQKAKNEALKTTANSYLKNVRDKYITISDKGKKRYYELFVISGKVLLKNKKERYELKLDIINHASKNGVIKFIAKGIFDSEPIKLMKVDSKGEFELSLVDGSVFTFSKVQ